MQAGMFSGLWGGISNTLGYGALEISEYTGSADKKREFELALAKFKYNESLLKEQGIKYIIIGSVVLVLIIVIAVVIIKK